MFSSRTIHPHLLPVALSAILAACAGSAPPTQDPAAIQPAAVAQPGPPPCAFAAEVTPPYQGRKASLPAVPVLSNAPIRQGNDFTVHGAVHHLNSRVHASEVRDKVLSIVGYVVRTNFAAA